MRWPFGPHLALNPPYLFIFVFVFVFFVPFLSWLLIEKPCFPPKKAFSVYFLCFLFLSPSTFFDLPLFLFLFLCLSLALVCLSSFLSFFIPSCLSCLLSFCFLFLSLFIFISSLLLFSGQNNMKILNYDLFLHRSFLFFMVSCLVFPFKSLFLIFVFLILSYVFCSTWMFLVSRQTTLKTHFFWWKGVLQQNGFFLSTCVLQNVKSYRFFCPFFCPILVDVQKAL